jgi:DNA-directed RNA polymerase specialized sigma24 family protein
MAFTENQARKLLSHLHQQDVIVGADHLAHDMSAAEISALRGIPLRTVERCIARVYVAIQTVGAPRPKPVRTSARHLIRGFTPALAMAL